jgi:hypothetical protein
MKSQSQIDQTARVQAACAYSLLIENAYFIMFSSLDRVSEM